jgi:hypothetical protein
MKIIIENDISHFERNFQEIIFPIIKKWEINGFAISRKNSPKNAESESHFSKRFVKKWEMAFPISRKHLPKNEEWRFPFLEKIYREMRNEVSHFSKKFIGKWEISIPFLKNIYRKMIMMFLISRKHLPKIEDWRFPFLVKIYREIRNQVSHFSKKFIGKWEMIIPFL